MSWWGWLGVVLLLWTVLAIICAFALGALIKLNKSITARSVGAREHRDVGGREKRGAVTQYPAPSDQRWH